MFHKMIALNLISCNRPITDNERELDVFQDDRFCMKFQKNTGFPWDFHGFQGSEGIQIEDKFLKSVILRKVPISLVKI